MCLKKFPIPPPALIRVNYTLSNNRLSSSHTVKHFIEITSIVILDLDVHYMRLQIVYLQNYRVELIVDIIIVVDKPCDRQRFYN